MRKPIIIGNWKMNNNIHETVALVEELKPLVADASCDVAVCPTFVNLAAAVEAAKGSNISIGAQNVHWAEKGAYTGEISTGMLKEIGIKYAIIGHSERRQYFGETDETVNLRTKAALASGLIPVVCVGELLEQRESGETETVLSTQVIAALNDVSNTDVETLVIAYEPVWAIGTGRTATKEQANETIGYIRSVITNLYNVETAQKVRIQYGGSMNPANAGELMSMPEIDGGLIGGASLKAVDFSKVVNYSK